MANPEHLSKLIDQPDSWNEWRSRQDPSFKPDLRGAVFQQLRLFDLDLTRANLYDARFLICDLVRVDFGQSDLREVTFYGGAVTDSGFRGSRLTSASFVQVRLTNSNLQETRLEDARIGPATIWGCNLRNAFLGGVRLLGTAIIDSDLSGCRGSETCDVWGPCSVDHLTIAQSRDLPGELLRRCGLPDVILDNVAVLRSDPLNYYSVFISYASDNDDFAQRLYNDLQGEGVRCWFAPEDMKIGDEIAPRINEAIRTYDKLLVVLSEQSIESAWVRREVNRGLAEEQRRKETVLFPIRIDDAVMDSTEQWADDLRRRRNIGDFSVWKKHDAYREAFDRLIRDLKSEMKG